MHLLPTLIPFALGLLCGLTIIAVNRLRPTNGAVEECPACEAKWSTRARTAARASREIGVLRAEHDAARHPNGPPSIP